MPTGTVSTTASVGLSKAAQSGTVTVYPNCGCCSPTPTPCMMCTACCSNYLPTPLDALLKGCGGCLNNTTIPIASADCDGIWSGGFAFFAAGSLPQPPCSNLILYQPSLPASDITNLFAGTVTFQCDGANWQARLNIFAYTSPAGSVYFSIDFTCSIVSCHPLHVFGQAQPANPANLIIPARGAHPAGYSYTTVFQENIIYLADCFGDGSMTIDITQP